MDQASEGGGRLVFDCEGDQTGFVVLLLADERTECRIIELADPYGRLTITNEQDQAKEEGLHFVNGEDLPPIG